MRRTYWTAGLILILAVGFLGLRAFLAPASSNAQPLETRFVPETIPGATDSPPTDLAISQVILYSNGVGYFQREGQVQDNARVDLTFPVQNINDLLKSMVLQDLGHGHISAVSYDSHDPIDKTLKSFAVNLTNNPSFGQILNQGRGEKIEVHSVDQAMLVGTLLGVESRLGAGKDPTLVETLNLLCDDGMRGVRLDHVKRVRFLNARMDAEMRRALEVLASARDAQKKTVSLKFTGAGQRQVKVGYVVEQPVWRTSYRLLVNKDGKLFVQGWAIVENTSNEDWKDVKLSLVSGRPISFQMDLYQPLYVNRPMVQPEQIASIQPQTHAGGRSWGISTGARNEDAFLKELDGYQGPAPCAPAAPPPSVNGPIGGFVNGGPGTGQAASTCTAAGPNGVLRRNPGPLQNSQQLNLQNGVVAAASAAELGDFFQYVIDQPVTVARQKSAMIPIVNKNIQGTKLSLYNPARHPKYPLLALELKNDTGLHLMQGPVTVFEGSSYAGDAQILDLQRGEKRLISYAVDLGTEVERTQKQNESKRIKVTIKDGMAKSRNKVRERTTYAVRSRASHDRVVCIEHPYRADYTLVSKTQPRERTETVCRYELRVPAGKSAKLEVIEEKANMTQQSGIPQAEELRQMVRCQCTNNKLMAALKKTLELRQKLSAIQEDLAQKKQELEAITKDQERLRANLKEMPQSAAAYKRYLAKFDSQETEIEKLQERIKALQTTEQKQNHDLVSFWVQLNVEGEVIAPAEMPNGSTSEVPVPTPPALTPPPSSPPISY
jgi:hypothetical protein